MPAVVAFVVALAGAANGDSRYDCAYCDRHLSYARSLLDRVRGSSADPMWFDQADSDPDGRVPHQRLLLPKAGLEQTIQRMIASYEAELQACNAGRDGPQHVCGPRGSSSTPASGGPTAAQAPSGGQSDPLQQTTNHVLDDSVAALQQLGASARKNDYSGAGAGGDAASRASSEKVDLEDGDSEAATGGIPDEWQPCAWAYGKYLPGEAYCLPDGRVQLMMSRGEYAARKGPMQHVPPQPPDATLGKDVGQILKAYLSGDAQALRQALVQTILNMAPKPPPSPPPADSDPLAIDRCQFATVISFEPDAGPPQAPDGCPGPPPPPATELDFP